MVITCPKCKAKLNLPNEKIRSGGIRFRCSRCKMSLVYKGKRSHHESTPVSGTSSQTTFSSDTSATQSPGEFVHKTGKGEGEQKTTKVADVKGQESGLHVKEVAQKKESIRRQKPKARPEDTRKEASVPPSAGPSPEDTAYAEEMSRRYGFMAVEKERLEEKPFFAHLPDVFSYPLKGGGILMLIAGTVFFTVLLFFSRYAFFFGIIGYVFAGGYLASFMMKIVSHTADGEIDLPDWPDLSDWWDDIIIPMFQIVMVSVISFLPLIIYIIFGASSGPFSVAIIILLLLLGILYQPMALISISIHQRVTALNPLLLLPAIAKVPLDYAIACIVLFLLFIFKGIFNYFILIPFVGPFLDNFIMFYLLIIEMRILGLIYYSNREIFGWI